MSDNEPTFDRVEAIMRKQPSEHTGEIERFNNAIKDVANRFIVRRRWHLWGLIPDGSSVEMINIGSEEPWRLRIWPIPGQKDLYVDNSKRLVQRTSPGVFRRVGFDDFTPNAVTRSCSASTMRSSSRWADPSHIKRYAQNA